MDSYLPRIRNWGFYDSEEAKHFIVAGPVGGIANSTRIFYVMVYSI